MILYTLEDFVLYMLNLIKGVVINIWQDCPKSSTKECLNQSRFLDILKFSLKSLEILSELIPYY